MFIFRLGIIKAFKRKLDNKHIKYERKRNSQLESSLGIKADVISMAKWFTTFCLDIIDIITFMLN